MKIYLRLLFTFLYIVSQCDFYNAEYGVIDSKKTTIRKFNTEKDDSKNNEGYQKSCEEQDKLHSFTDKSFKDEVSGDQYEVGLRPPRGEHVLDELPTTKDDSSETDIDEVDNDETDTLKYRFRGLKQRQMKRRKNDYAKENIAFEYPPLHRITPQETGARVLLSLQPEINHTRITRATSPPVFEIPNFLSDEECEMIKEKAEEKGLKPSHIFGSDVEDESQQTSNISNIPRLSSTAWIDNNHIGRAFYSSFVSRLARLTEVPVDVIKRSEYLQVVKYEEGGHYHAHIDSHEISNLPCCFQSNCTSRSNEVDWTLCCRPCRFMTVLIYLNDVHSGGQTVFPFADLSEQEIQVIKETVPDWKSLGRHCHDSSLSLQPKKGTAIMWYSHFLERETGYLSTLDKRSVHGSCDVERGAKWVANLWVAFSTYKDRFKPSVYFP